MGTATGNRLRAAMCAMALLGGVMVMAASPVGAATIVVNPGQSIQAAVDSAPSGSTIDVRPGTYLETVTITRGAITLRGAGAGATRLRPPAAPSGPCAFGPDFVQGICVLGNINFETFQVVSNVRAVSITGFDVSGFSGSGIFVFGGSGTRLERNRTNDNGAYGVFAISSTGTRIQSSHASGNADAGFYVGDSPNANATVSGNTATDNGIGIFIRAASRGTISGNRLTDNCIGLLFLAEPEVPRDWYVTANVANHNNRACPGFEDEPPSSGIGIQVLGGRSITIVGNTVNDNRPSGPTLGSAGIGVINGNDVTVSRNTALGNDPDLFWDGTGTGVRFVRNRCATSIPPGLC